MQILVSSVGTRGDVQPAIALAVQLRELGHAVRLCAPPNFVDEVAALGFEARAIGVEMRAPPPGAPPPPIPDLITDQFAVVAEAADGCGLIVGAGAHQYAVRSVAELRGIPSVVAVYAPTSLPSADLAAWAETRQGWNRRALERVNANRIALGLDPVDDVLGHILGAEPWLAADATLGPASPGVRAVQTGAWVLPDTSPLPPELEAFLRAGEPPLYLGLGSMPAGEDVGRSLVEAARAAGRRAILSKGWAGLALLDDRPDCFAVDDVNHQALFPRVAAVVHHGGAGTTTAAALAGTPQVVTPVFADQFYWARRVVELGIGATTPAAGLDPAALAHAIGEALRTGVAERAREVARTVSSDGAKVAARRLTEPFAEAAARPVRTR
jgi:vancomycin aglycone glucosyltransferase